MILYLHIYLAALVSVSSASEVGWLDDVSGTNKALYGTTMINLASAWAVGELDTVLKSDGTAWTPRETGLFYGNLGCTWFDVSFPEHCFPNPDYKPGRYATYCTYTTGWVVGEHAIIAKTEDDGATWNEQSNFDFSKEPWLTATFHTVTLRAVQAASIQTAYACGDNGTVLATFDGGGLWSALDTRVATGLHDLFFLSNSTGFAVGQGGVVIATEDFGLTWHLVTSEAFSAATLRAIKCWRNGYDWKWRTYEPGAGHSCFIVGREGTILFSSDTGATWTRQSACAEDADLYDVAFREGLSQGWAVGVEGIVCYTEDLGATWQAQVDKSDADHYAIDNVDHFDPVMVGDHGRIMSYYSLLPSSPHPSPPLMAPPHPFPRPPPPPPPPSPPPPSLHASSPPSTPSAPPSAG
ncbi:hypothetical protein CYMTET_51456 [Cymbomonas tetramitiformis]|uniref:Photosynthesis system II assembly factor Ycf48/Hcf136-like domain-containing protein n=1 Tax=Cymbomonas tetramitiformis TaxID=36881 RepID=A0AAE0ETP0_9CHLO|nr:hypothetical protein CYMTET_51456 [Cymbomonas tetramitiformis]